MNKCNLCPRSCGIDRSASAGFCGPRRLTVARADLHFFEEPPISGTRGSGTIFFSGCSLRCVFCQNYAVSRNETGRELTAGELADLFRMLEDRGAHNINLVTPTHFTEEILDALEQYRPSIPVVWNTHSYENPETVERIADAVDIFLPDLKYFSPEISKRYAGVTDYFERALEAIRHMIARKKNRFGEDGMMKSGVIIRHLILPMNVDETFSILETIVETFESPLVSLMSQYTPFGDLAYPELRRKITRREYDRCVSKMNELGLDGFVQELSSSGEAFIPDWNMK